MLKLLSSHYYTAIYIEITSESALTVPDYSTVVSEVRALTWKAPTSNHSCHNARKEKQHFTLYIYVDCVQEVNYT